MILFEATIFNPIILILIILVTTITPHRTLFTERSPLIRERRGLDENVATITDLRSNKKDCLDITEFRPECSDAEYNERQLSNTIMICLNSCANCVKQWRTGVYNGHSCANDCIERSDNPVESMDPSCSELKYFSPTVLATI